MSMHKTPGIHIPRSMARRSRETFKAATQGIALFEGAAIITDLEAFEKALQAYKEGTALVERHVHAVRRVWGKARLAKPVQAEAPPADSGAAAVQALQAPQAWQPSGASIAAGQQVQQRIFEHPDNQSVSAFAKLVCKTPQAVYDDIRARKLLSLKLSERKQRVPAWQAEPKVRQFVAQVLALAPTLDAWTVYQALVAPVGVLGGLSLVQACQQGLHAPERLAEIFLAELGLVPAAGALALAQAPAAPGG